MIKKGVFYGFLLSCLGTKDMAVIAKLDIALLQSSYCKCVEI